MDVEEVRNEYDDIKSQLVEFLESTVVHAAAETILSRNLYAYIFDCFRIRPYDKQKAPGRATPADRHAVEVFSAVVSDATGVELFFVARTASGSAPCARFCWSRLYKSGRRTGYFGQGDTRFLFC